MNDSREMLEYDNNERVGNLSQKVALLKNYAIDIDDETKRHNRFLDDVDDDFGSNFVFLKTTSNRLNRMIRSNRSPKFTCYLALGICVFLFLIYFIISSKMSKSSVS